MPNQEKRSENEIDARARRQKINAYEPDPKPILAEPGSVNEPFSLSYWLRSEPHPVQSRHNE